MDRLKYEFLKEQYCTEIDKIFKSRKSLIEFRVELKYLIRKIKEEKDELAIEDLFEKIKEKEYDYREKEKQIEKGIEDIEKVLNGL